MHSDDSTRIEFTNQASGLSGKSSGKPFSEDEMKTEWVFVQAPLLDSGAALHMLYDLHSQIAQHASGRGVSLSSITYKERNPRDADNTDCFTASSIISPPDQITMQCCLQKKIYIHSHP